MKKIFKEIRKGILTAGLVGMLTASSLLNYKNATAATPPRLEQRVEQKSMRNYYKIAFTSNRDRDVDIYVMNADGSELRNLTSFRSPTTDIPKEVEFSSSPSMRPSWSPDGKKIAFIHRGLIGFDLVRGAFPIVIPDEIYVMNPDGGERKNLTNNLTIWDSFPSWSPDGKKIAFVSDRDGNSEIYIMNADGSGQKNLTNNSTNFHGPPSWSPDGKKIAFDAFGDRSYEIYIINVGENRQTRLTNNLARDYSPSWSPNGKKIAFTSDRDGNWALYVMNADGSGQTRLTNNHFIVQYPSWSPDGKKIAFTSISLRDETSKIYIMNSDGSNQKNLTNKPPFKDYSPSWSPDGKKIAFVSNRDGNREIYIMNADGSEQKNLTNNPARDYNPSWCPVLSKKE